MKGGDGAEYISISEMARLRNISTETLRHYDRIGLLKPDRTDAAGKRFYSVAAYERLQTIKELKQIGMSLSEIGEYFRDRNFRSSYELLERQQAALDKKIRELLKIRRQVKNKKAYMETITPAAYRRGVFVRDIPDRFCLTLGAEVRDEIELSYQLMRLENKICSVEKYAPLYATERYAALIPFDETRGPEDKYPRELIIFIDKDKAGALEGCRAIKGGRYCCVRSAGDFWQQDEAIESLLAFAKRGGFSPSFDHIIEKVVVDYTISDRDDERLYEFQLRV